MFMAAIFIGATGYTLELICDQEECCVGFLLLLILPITMIMGIGKALGEICGEAAPEIVGEGCDWIGELTEEMMCW